MTKTTAAPTAAKPSAPRPTRAAPVAPPKPDQVETGTAATAGDYLKKEPGKKVPVNFNSDRADHQAVKVWCAEHGYKVADVYMLGAKMFMASKEALAKSK
ncbi:hypothetical protein JET76_22865 [Pseudomonas putida]|uniref:hypothetical protein n=1 Tax=Pseudomonas putida TaxID=303 RepID=UPI0018E6C2E7|nr:hypothetical protein [Pseudomonas putida]MBI6944170.1 hypothetical protein [Pseudomonas putida]MBI6960336.1 hypothetical protein [Pseudomonas putida]